MIVKSYINEHLICFIIHHIVHNIIITHTPDYIAAGIDKVFLANIVSQAIGRCFLHSGFKLNRNFVFVHASQPFKDFQLYKYLVCIIT